MASRRLSTLEAVKKFILLKEIVDYQASYKYEDYGCGQLSKALDLIKSLQ